jgi:hypothetical protein
MSYILLRGKWCCTVVLNVNAPTDDKIDDMNHSFYKELRHIFKKFLKNHIKTLLGDCKAKVDREDIFRQFGMRVYIIMESE